VEPGVTQPKLATRGPGGSRLYVFPDGAKHPGVTSIIGQLPKPFLVPWAAKLSAQWAMDNLPILNDLAKRDTKAAVELIAGASRRSTAGSADTGTEVHGYFEALLLGDPLPALSEDAQPFAGPLHDFVADWKPTAVMTEGTVRSDSVGYAGSFDAIVDIAGEHVLLDLKTGKGTYPEVSLQLAAYRFADSLADGSPVPRIDACAVLHVRPGHYSLSPVKGDAEAFEFFKHLRALFGWDSAKSSHIGAALTPPSKEN
jgi:hypothetical protein